MMEDSSETIRALKDWNAKQSGKGSTLDLWRLSDVLTVHQASCLIVGVDPGERKTGDGVPGYEAASHALLRAMNKDEVECAIEEGDHFRTAYIRVDSLRDWLKSKGVTSGFFFSSSGQNPS